MVDMGGAGGALRLLSWSCAIVVVGGWWHVSIGNGAISATRLCAMPGSLDLVDRGMEGMWLVASDRSRRGGGALWWLSVGGSLAAPRSQRHTLLRNVGAFPGYRGSAEGGAHPIDVVAGGIPSHRCISVGSSGGTYSVPLSRTSAVCWDLWAYWQCGGVCCPYPPSHWVWLHSIVASPGWWHAAVAKVALCACPCRPGCGCADTEVVVVAHAPSG